MKTIYAYFLFAIGVFFSSIAFAQDLPKLVNISGRAQVTSGTPLIGGFVIKSPRQILIRAVGPSLSSFGVTGINKDPILTLHGIDESGDCILATNDNWDNNPSIKAQALMIGAFPLVSGSKDAAILITLEAGAYTAVVSCSEGADGIALMEIYDIDWRNGVGLVNLSLRGWAGTGDKALIPGFVMGAPGLDMGVLLIRAVGPGLEQFGVTDFLIDPTLTLRQGNFVLRTADNWFTEFSNYFMTSRGAFALPANSKDAVIGMVIGTTNQDSRAYTAVAEDKNQQSGTVLLEIYAAPLETVVPQ